MSGILSVQGDGFIRRTFAKNTAGPILEPVAMSATVVVNGETLTYQQQVPGLDWYVIERDPELRGGAAYAFAVTAPPTPAHTPR